MDDLGIISALPTLLVFVLAIATRRPIESLIPGRGRTEYVYQCDSLHAVPLGRSATRADCTGLGMHTLSACNNSDSLCTNSCDDLDCGLSRYRLPLD